MFKAFKESQRRHGPWHIAVFLMFGIISGIIGLYYLLSKNLIYCPIGDTDATFSLTYDDRGVLSQVGGLKFWVPANYTLFLHNQRSGKHKWLVLHGLLPGLRALTEKLGMLEQNKLDDCDFYIKDKVVIALAQKNPRPRWLDRGGIDKKSAAKLYKALLRISAPMAYSSTAPKCLRIIMIITRFKKFGCSRMYLGTNAGFSFIAGATRSDPKGAIPTPSL